MGGRGHMGGLGLPGVAGVGGYGFYPGLYNPGIAVGGLGYGGYGYGYPYFGAYGTGYAYPFYGYSSTYYDTSFVAPALLATSAMNGAIFDSTFNIFFKLKYAKVYDAVLATPMRTGDVALGEIGWALIRGGLYACAFIVIMLAMGLVHSIWAVFAIPVALLIGFAFAGAGMAATTFMRSWQDFEYVTLTTLPMFLFSATFYPISVYPRPIQIIVDCTPLYQGIALLPDSPSGTSVRACCGTCSIWPSWALSAWPSPAAGWAACCCASRTGWPVRTASPSPRR